MATAAMTSTSSTSSSISSTNNSHSTGTGSSSSNSKLFSGSSSGYGSLPSSSGLSSSSSSIRSRRGKQGAGMLSCSGPSHYSLSSSGSSSVIHSSSTVSRLSASSKKDNSNGVSLYKLRGLKWKSLYENPGILNELNSSDNEDSDRHHGRGKSTVMRLDKSDIGLYGRAVPFFTKDMTTAAITSTINSHSSSIGTGSSSSNSKLFSGSSSGYGSLPSSSGLSSSSSSIRSRRGKQGSGMLSCSGPSHYSLSSGNSSVIHSSGTSRLSASSRKDNSAGVSPYKLRGLKWKTFYENPGIFTELNSSDNEDNDRHHGRGKSTVMRLDKSDMGLYGLCPETDPFYAVICDICNAVVKPQGLQKHMLHRHNSHSSHHGNHYHTSSQHTSTSRNLSGSGHSERSNEHYSPSHSATAAATTAGITTGLSNSSNAAPSNSFISSTSNSSRSKSKSTSKLKSKSGKSSSNQVSSSNVSSTSSPSSSSSASLSTQRHHSSSNSTSSNSSASNGSSASTANCTSSKSNYCSTSHTTAITATNTSSHSITSSTRASNPSAQKTDSNPKQIKPPLTGTACLSTLSNVSQHLQPQGGSPAKGMVAPTTHNEASITIPDCLMPSSAVTSSNSNSSISSSSSSSTSTSVSSSTSLSSSSSSSSRRTYGRNKGSSSERKNLPVKDREYDADRHCGVLTGDPPRPCTRSLTCKSHALSMRRMVNGRTKSFDKLLSDHRTTKDSSLSSRSSHNSVSRAIPEFESSNSSSSIEMDRRSTQSVSSNSNLSTEAQPHSSSSSMSPTPSMASTTPPTTISAAAPTAAAVPTGVTAAVPTGVVAAVPTGVVPAPPPSSSSQNSLVYDSNRRISAPAIVETRDGRPIADIRESIETIRTNTGRIQLNLSRDEILRPDGNQNSSGGSSTSSRHCSLPAQGGEQVGPPKKYQVATRLIDTERQYIPEELLDDKKYEKSVFSEESTVLKRPITLIAEEDEEEYKRARTIDNDIDLMNISKLRKLQLKIQHRVQTKNKYRFRAPGELSQYALSMPPAAAAVAKLFVAHNPNATVTNARFVLDPETNTVLVSMNGIFDPNDLRVNWKNLDKKFVEQIILDSFKPHGVTVGDDGHLKIPQRTFTIPNPADEGFLIHHHTPMTEEEYANLRPEFINGMPKPICSKISGIKTEIKDENNPIDTSHLPPILPTLHKELRNIKIEIKQEIKEEPMNEDEILEYCQPAAYLEGNETYGDIPPEVSAIDPSSFDVPTVDHPQIESYSNEMISPIEMPRTEISPEQQMTQAEISQCLDNNMPPAPDFQSNETLAMNVTAMDIDPMLEHTMETATNDANAPGNNGDVYPTMELSNFTVTSNEITFNIPLGDITPQEISNAISAITGMDVARVANETPQDIQEQMQQQQVQQMQQQINDVPNIGQVPASVPPVLEEPVEPMSIMAELDDESFDDNDLGLVDAIASNTKITHGDIVFSSHQEKENAKVLIENNFYDTSPFAEDVIRGLKTWHNSAPRPLSVNMFGLVKLRGGTTFKKNVVRMRKTNYREYFRIDSNSIVVNGNGDQISNLIKQPNVINRNLILRAPQRRIVALGAANAVRRQSATTLQQASNPFFKPYNSTNGTRPKLEKRSIILHKGQMNKTCRALRSNIVGKLSEHLLGYKKFNNSAKNSSGAGISNSSSSTSGSSNGRSSSSSKSTGSINGSTSRTHTHLDGSSKAKSSRSSSGGGGGSNRSSGSSTTSSVASNSVFLSVPPPFNSTSSSSGNNSIRHNTNGAVHRVPGSKTTNHTGHTGLSVSMSSSGASSSFVSSRSSLANHHRNGTEFN